MKEEWKDVVGFEGIYQVSSSGQVKSLDRFVQVGKGIRFRQGLVLKQKTKKGGYLCVHLRNQDKECHPTVHRLVAEHFIDNPDMKPTVNHIDGNKKNNSSENLEWATSKEQIQHAIDSGLLKNTASPKYSKEFKKEILNYYDQTNCSIYQLSVRFGISERTAGRLVKFGVKPRTTTKVNKDGSFEVKNIITKEQVEEIKKLRKQGMTLLEISKLFDRGTSQIWRICKDLSRTTNIE